MLKPFNLPRTLRSARYQATGRGHWQTFAPSLSPDAAQRRVFSVPAQRYKKA
ncbi:MAG: hypothetical protein JXQ97_17340 [Natronospirillum sp.]